MKTEKDNQKTGIKPSRRLELAIQETYAKSISNTIKHNMACRAISDKLSGSSVSILLYKGQEKGLRCVGKYINPEKYLSSEPKNSTNRYVNIMNHIDILEFATCHTDLRIDNNENDPTKFTSSLPENIKQIYSIYKNHSHYNSHSIKDFFEIWDRYEENIFLYKQYVEKFLVEFHPVNDTESLSGLYYKYLHDSDKRVKDDRLRFLGTQGENICKIIDKPQAFIVDLNLNPLTKPICRTNLINELNLAPKDGGYYVVLPIRDKNERIIGMLRITFDNDTIDKFYDTYKVKKTNNAIDRIITILNKFHINEIIYTIGDNLHHNELFTAYRSVTLKKNFYKEFNDFNGLANELADVTNSYGCLIRLSSGRSGALIKGYSESVRDYYMALKSSNDPHIKGGAFHQEIIDVFYDELTSKIRLKKGTTPVDIVSVLVTYDDQGKVSISYQYIDDNLRIQSSFNWPWYLNSARVGLETIFKESYQRCNDFEINQVLLIPIFEVQFGLVSLANTKMHPFIHEDIEMILPIVKRVGLELEESKNKEKSNDALKKDALIKSSNVLLHQLGSPILSVQNHFENIIERAIDDKSRKLRMEEMVSTYQDFLDMLKTQQFFFGLINNKKPKPNITSFNLGVFVIEKVRSYQLRAKKDRDCGVHIFQVERPRQIYEVKTDRVLLGHVIQCLVDNAIKYSFTERQREKFTKNNPLIKIGRNIVVTIDVQQELSSISVVNYGCPIEDDELYSLLQMEKRGLHARTFDETGNGIGLFVVKQILDLLGGRIRIKHNQDSRRTEIIAEF